MTSTTSTIAAPRARPNPSIAFPLVLIALGGLFLLGTNGYLAGVSWIRIGSLWPVILLVIGVDMLLRPRSMIAAIAAVIVILGAAILYVVAAPPGLLGGNGVSPGGFVAAETVARQGDSELALTIGYGAGALRLSGGATELVSVRSSHEDIDLQRVARSGTSSSVTVRSRDDRMTFEGRSWDVRVPSDIPVALTMDLGAGSFDVDLTDVMITRATLNNGASDLTVDLPRPKGNVPIIVSTGASSVTLVMPTGAEYRVTTSGALNTINGLQETPGYAAAADRLSITLSAGVSTITIR